MRLSTLRGRNNDCAAAKHRVCRIGTHTRIARVDDSKRAPLSTAQRSGQFTDPAA
jgi:hypothetical protein